MSKFFLGLFLCLTISASAVQAQGVPCQYNIQRLLYDLKRTTIPFESVTVLYVSTFNATLVVIDSATIYSLYIDTMVVYSSFTATTGNFLSNLWVRGDAVMTQSLTTSGTTYSQYYVSDQMIFQGQNSLNGTIFIFKNEAGTQLGYIDPFVNNPYINEFNLINSEYDVTQNARIFAWQPQGEIHEKFLVVISSGYYTWEGDDSPVTYRYWRRGLECTTTVYADVGVEAPTGKFDQIVWADGSVSTSCNSGGGNFFTPATSDLDMNQYWIKNVYSQEISTGVPMYNFDLSEINGCGIVMKPSYAVGVSSYVHYGVWFYGTDYPTYPNAFSGVAGRSTASGDAELMLISGGAERIRLDDNGNVSIRLYDAYGQGTTAQFIIYTDNTLPMPKSPGFGVIFDTTSLRYIAKCFVPMLQDHTSFYYSQHPTFASDLQITDKKYVDDTYSVLEGTATDLYTKYNTLASTGTDLYTKYNTLASTGTDLYTKYNTLASTGTDLYTKYNTLDDNYDVIAGTSTDLYTKYNTLASTGTDLYTKYNTLASTGTDLYTNYNTLASTGTDLYTKYNTLDDNYDIIADSITDLYNGTPDNVARSSCTDLYTNYNTLASTATDLYTKYNTLDDNYAIIADSITDLYNGTPDNVARSSCTDLYTNYNTLASTATDLYTKYNTLASTATDLYTKTNANTASIESVALSTGTGEFTIVFGTCAETNDEAICLIRSTESIVDVKAYRKDTPANTLTFTFTDLNDVNLLNGSLSIASGANWSSVIASTQSVPMDGGYIVKIISGRSDRPVTVCIRTVKK